MKYQLVTVLFGILLFSVSCSSKKENPYSDRAAREALGTRYESIRRAEGRDADVDAMKKMVLDDDPFAAGAALRRVSGWQWEKARPVFISALKSGLSLVRDRAAAYLLDGEEDHGAPESDTWQETFTLLLRELVAGRMSRENMKRFARLAGSELHGQVRDVIRLSSGPKRLRGIEFLCTMAITDDDVRFLRRNTAWITDDNVFSLCEDRVRRATFGKKDLSRGAQ